MSLFELPVFFPKATRKIALKSPKEVNVDQMLALGRKGTETVSRAFYVSALRETYWLAGITMLAAVGLLALIFQESAAGYLIFLLWGLGVGFVTTSFALDYRLTKFQLLFADNPTEERMLASLQKIPSNLLWIVIASLAGGIPFYFIELF